MDRLADMYNQSIRESLGKDLGITNPMAVPRLVKITLNIGLNQDKNDTKKIASIARVMAIIAGQKPSIRKSRKAISSFKLRAGEPVGLSLTLRGKRMYDFLERFIRVVLPRVRDFRGIQAKSFDGRGNLSVGLRETGIFPEIQYEDADVLRGLEVTFVTTATTDEQGSKLLTAFGMPLVAKK